GTWEGARPRWQRAGGPARSSGEAPVMGVERRGRVICGWFVWSTGAVGPGRNCGERAEVVREAGGDSQPGGLGGIRAGQGERRRTGSRRGHAGGIREGAEAQSVQDLEPDVLRQLPPTPGGRGGATKAAWR